jgi:glucose/arabinose dehydrogenase
MIYMENGEFKNKLVRTSSKDGLRMDSLTTIIDNIPSTNMSHQVQMPSIGFDGKLYLNVGDGTVSDSAQDDRDLRGKVLRLNLDGSIPTDNPIPGSPVFAKGFRNTIQILNAFGKLIIALLCPDRQRQPLVRLDAELLLEAVCKA